MITYLIDKIKTDPHRLAMNLSIVWDKHCAEYDICDKCGKRLIAKIHNEPREHQGQSCEEAMTEYICLSCGQSN